MFCLHSPIKNALKTGTFEKTPGDTQLCFKRHRTWTVEPKQAIFKSFCREINALSPGYKNFEKCLADAELLTIFVKDLICTS
jgi:hypothetical protein